MIIFFFTSGLFSIDLFIKNKENAKNKEIIFTTTSKST